MTIRLIKISELQDLTRSAEYASWKHVPITPARAYSQSLNPYAQPEDISLILAIDDNSGELISYAGAFPAELQNKQAIRFAWNSCWWVAEGVSGEIAMNTFIRFLQVWEKKVAFSDMTEKTFKIVRNLKFCKTFQRDGVVLHLRPGFVNRFRDLSKRTGISAGISGMFLYSGIPWLADKLLLALLILPQKNYSGNSKTPVPEMLQETDADDKIFMQRNGADHFHLPDSTELKMPSWLVKQSRENRFLASKYYFSSFSHDFSRFWLRWRADNKTIALVLVSIRDGVLKTLYVYFEESYRSVFPSYFMAYCFGNYSIHSLITATPILVSYIKQHKLFILKRRYFTRYSAISEEILSDLHYEPVMQDGDGDYRFT